MKFYLSSYRIGNETDKLKTMILVGNRRTAYIANAMDFSTDLARRAKSEQFDIEQLSQVGLSDIENIDLRKYFNKQDELEKKLFEFGVIWVRGGNCFVLIQAMRLSGFDEIFKNLLKKKDILYGGYSAGICVLAPTLEGMELTDDPYIRPYQEELENIWEGLSVLDYAIIPHYRSNHPESKQAEETVEYMVKNNIPFKTLSDGEVIIIE